MIEILHVEDELVNAVITTPGDRIEWEIDDR